MKTHIPLFLLCILTIAPTVIGLDIQFKYSASVTGANKVDLEQAAQMWERKLHDSITVRINVDAVADLENDKAIVAGSEMARVKYAYDKVRQALITDAGYYWSWAEKEAGVMMALPTNSLPVEVSDMAGGVKVEQSTFIAVMTANAKALGLMPPHDKVLSVAGCFPQPNKGTDGYYPDGIILYDKAKGISIGTAAHEIGHVLGFFSHVDLGGMFNLGLFPTTLDLWRFKETGAPHNISVETRRLIQGPAEYYDTILKNRSMSQGKSVIDNQCYMYTQRCQASHWRDDLFLLMSATGYDSRQIENDDLHALDYIGYCDKLAIHPDIAAGIYSETVFGWMPNIVSFDKFEWTNTFPPPPNPENIRPPFQPDCAMIVGIGFNIDGMEKRSGLGFARYEDDRRNPFETIYLPDELEGELIEFLPAALLDLYFESDVEGVPFTASALLPTSGAPFDPNLDEYGGYVLTLALDGVLDRVDGDIDAIATIALVADENKLPNPEAYNSFRIAPDYEHNKLIVYDVGAFGILNPYCADLIGANQVNFRDFAILADNWQLAEPDLLGDLNSDGIVDFTDLTIFTAYWLYDCWRF